MCSLINVCSINIVNNPAKITDPFKIEIVFEAFENITEEIVWELVFVATDGNEENDQVLDSVGTEQIREGRHKFVFDAPAPKIETLRADDLLDVTLLLLKCTYREQLFLKVGWFMTHSYADPELVANPPEQPIPEKMQRTVVTEDYRVTTYAIRWTSMPEEAAATESVADMEANGDNDFRVEDESMVLDGDGAATSSATVAVDVQSDEEDDDDDEEEEEDGSIVLGSSTDDDNEEEEVMDTSSGSAAETALKLLDGGADAKVTNSSVEGNCVEIAEDGEPEAMKLPEDHGVGTTAAPFADKTNNGQ